MTMKRSSVFPFMLLAGTITAGAFSLQCSARTSRHRYPDRRIHQVAGTSSRMSSSTLNLSSSSSPPTSPRLRRFYILRHGETDANASHIIQGSADISRLTAKGREQASTIGTSAFCPIKATNGEICSRITSVYVSPLTRARDTLTIVRQSAPKNMLPPDGTDVVLPNLREIDFYSWEGRTKEELKREYPAVYAAWKAGDPDGLVVDGRRPLWETWDRASLVWDEIRSRVEKDAAAATAEGGEQDDADTATLLVCHGTLGQALLGSAFGVNAHIFRRNKFPNCGMAEILWHAEDDMASSWRWHYPEPTEHGCLRDQLLELGEAATGAAPDASYSL